MRCRNSLFILFIICGIFFLGACSEVNTADESEKIEPVTYHIYGYYDENGDEIRFCYENASGFTYSMYNIFSDVKLISEDETSSLTSNCYFEIQVSNIGNSEITVLKNETTATGGTNSVTSGIISIKKTKNSFAATFNNFNCFVIQVS